MKILKNSFILIVLFISFLLISAWYLTIETAQLVPAEVIVVLGYPTLDNGKISFMQKSRVDKGIELYRKKLGKKLMFTGGAAWNDFVESETMKAYAISEGIPAQDIFIETTSTNTDENAEFASKILLEKNYSDIIIVTSPYHTRRANHLFKHFPFKVQIKSAPYPPMAIKDRFLALLNEYYGFARHGIKSLL